VDELVDRMMVMSPMRTIQDVLERFRHEFLEMPGLHLQPEQVQRLCGVEWRICQVVLDLLVNEKFLCVKLRDAAGTRRLLFRGGCRNALDRSGGDVGRWHGRAHSGHPRQTSG
jgi:hypothetical protein